MLVIIELKYGSTANKALVHIEGKWYKDIFKGYIHLPKIKTIGISVSKDKEVIVKCKLVNDSCYAISSFI
jgi:hypothetical protein